MSEVLHLSPSIAHVLLSRSPMHAWQAHSKGGNVRDEPSDAMRAGKLIDRLLFKTGAELVIVDAADWRTKAAKEAREAAEAKGAIAVLVDKHAESLKVADGLRASLLERGIDVAASKCQHRVVWDSAGVACKGFLDMCFIDENAGVIYDLKVTENAAPRALKIDGRSRLQHAAYIEALETLHPELAGRVTMQFVYAELGGDLTLAEPDATGRALGASQWRRAVQTWGECLASGKFPGYPREVFQVETKPWEMTEEMGAVIPAGGSPLVTF